MSTLPNNFVPSEQAVRRYITRGAPALKPGAKMYMLANHELARMLSEYQRWLSNCNACWINDHDSFVWTAAEPNTYLQPISTQLKYLVAHNQLPANEVALMFKIESPTKTKESIEDIFTAAKVCGYRIGLKHRTRVNFDNISRLEYFDWLVFKPTKDAELISMLDLLSEFTPDVVFVPEYVL